MRQIIYCMQFKGTGTAGSEPGTIKATTSATSCSVKTIVGPDGVEGIFIPAEGGMAFFESDVKMTGADSFLENGTITFGDGDNSLKFSTIGQGHLEPDANTKTMVGTVMWKIEGGEGTFENATGLITSNFSLSEAGEVVDHHFGVISIK